MLKSGQAFGAEKLFVHGCCAAGTDWQLLLPADALQLNGVFKACLQLVEGF